MNDVDQHATALRLLRSLERIRDVLLNGTGHLAGEDFQHLLDVIEGYREAERRLRPEGGIVL